jgi:3-oxoacyl-[acyl-carrier protein] reductase
MMNFKSQVAVITGGTRGIGKSIAEHFARNGADIIVCGRNPQAANEAADSLSSFGVKAVGLRLDVSNSHEVKETFEKIISEFKKIDILVNNAGITKDGLLMRMSEDAWDAVLDINLKGCFLCTKAVIPEMARQRYGRIINITSVAGFMGNPGQANYSASKAGIVGFTKTVAREYASRGITVNAVAPGFIETAMTDVLNEKIKEEMKKLIPIGRFGKVEDIANAVLFLASPESGYITGQTIHVNGGMYM